MKAPRWYQRLPRWGQKLVDQLGHGGIGGGTAAIFGGLALLGLSGEWAGAVGAASGSLAMGAYELAQNVGDTDNNYADMAIDLVVGVGSAVAIGAAYWAWA